MATRLPSTSAGPAAVDGAVGAQSLVGRESAEASSATVAGSVAPAADSDCGVDWPLLPPPLSVGRRPQAGPYVAKRHEPAVVVVV